MTWTCLRYYTTPHTLLLLTLPPPPLLHYPRSSVIPTMQGHSLLEDEKCCLKLPVLSASPTLADFKAHQKRATLSVMKSTTSIALEEGTIFIAS